MVTVFYQNPADAVRARMAANGLLFNEKYIRCMLWDVKDIPPHSNLYVKNLRPNVTARDLDQEFGKYGEVISSKIQYNSENESQGYGFVQFTNNREAESAIKSLNNKEMWGSTI
mmetsp:Transcript_33767/g.6110  ORF Transcript_33767/g.6110 Transcript_33767/m.6110 type:complete len:114 (-) Transcript_33767:1123-1464(-)